MTAKQNDDLQATKFIMNQQNDDLQDLQVIVQQQNNLLVTLQQQNDDLETSKHLYEAIMYNLMTIELTDYKKMDNNVLYYSPSFYTSHDGYNMKIIVSANGHGEGEGSHLSVFACEVRGGNDNDLNWPFVGDITFQLLNQLEDKNHHYKVILHHRLT